jgi:hypothetical protein
MAFQAFPKPPCEPPVCARCHTDMILLTAISDPKYGGRVLLFECGNCQITSLRPDA